MKESVGEKRPQTEEIKSNQIKKNHSRIPNRFDFKHIVILRQRIKAIVQAIEEIGNF